MSGIGTGGGMVKPEDVMEIEDDVLKSLSCCIRPQLPGPESIDLPDDALFIKNQNRNGSVRRNTAGWVKTQDAILWRQDVLTDLMVSPHAKIAAPASTQGKMRQP